MPGRRPRWRRTPRAPTRPTASGPRRTAGCARRSSATATGSCTARRSGASSTRRRCSSRPRATTTARGSRTRSRRRRSAARSRARCGSTRTSRRRSGSGTTSATRRSATSARTCSTAPGASASAAASATTSTRCAWSSVIERLNLTAPVRDGILRHSTGAGEPATLEGRIVRLVDRIAYINHDIDDALRAGVIAPGDLPAEEIAILGETGSRRIDALVHDLVEHSERAGRHRPGRGGRRRHAAAAHVHVRARLPRADRARPARADRPRAARAVRLVHRRTRTSCRPACRARRTPSA